MAGKFRTWLGVSMGVVAVSIPMFAHHGASAFDTSQVVTVPGGSITGFEFVNPHVQIRWEVRGEKGDVQSWVAEGTAPNMLYRSGWSRESLKPGDKLQSVSGNRCKDGGFCMRLRKIVLANGQELPVPQ